MQAIFEETVRRAAQRMKQWTKSDENVCTDDETSGGDHGKDDSHLEEPEDEQPSRKRAKTTDSSRLTSTKAILALLLPTLPGLVSPTSIMTAHGSTAVTTDSNPGDVLIKQEDGEDGEQMVTVYIGPQNQTDDLSQSPVLLWLHSWKARRPIRHGSGTHGGQWWRL